MLQGDQMDVDVLEQTSFAPNAHPSVIGVGCGTRSPVSKRCPAIGRPVVHIRSRPTLVRLGETNERRRVWCLDHQNIVVSSSKSMHELRTRLQGTVSPSRPCDSVAALLAPSGASTGTRCSSTPPSFYRRAPQRHSVSQSKKQKSRRSVRKMPTVATAPLLSFGSALDSLPEQMQCHAVTSRSVAGNDITTGPATVINSNTMATPLSLCNTRRATTPDVSLSRSSRHCREDHFTFDFIHGEDATQEEVFEESVFDFVDMALFGQNIAIICYGPTGSGKTYSMMGSMSEKRLGKQRKKHNDSPLVPLLVLDDSPGSFSCNYPGQSGADTVQRGKSRDRASGGEVLSGSHSRRASRHDMDCSTSTESVIHHSELEGKSLSALSRAICQGGERNGCSESLGLLPRLVLVLLERRGKPVKLVREDDATIRYTASKRGSDHVGGVKCGNSCGCEKEKNIDRRSGDAQWTLQELTFYGVELYLDEFCDLLDPSKRRVTNMGDIGGLDAFCQKLNDAVPQSGRAGGGASAASKGDAGYRGGGIPITSVDDFRRCYALASRNRVTKGHQRNDTSSRSHAVFILQLRFEYSDVSPTLAGAGSKGSSSSFYSYVAMVDLAGSERVKQTKVEGAQLREAQYINKSLSALSAVLLALHQRSGHVPYRDSKLTRLLRPCLERGSVLTLVHVSPCAAEEALNCLKFAEQVQHTAIQSHSLYNAAEELVAVFEDLNDPDVEERLLQYRRSEEEYKLLCAEVRLAYFYRTMGEGPQLPLFNTPTETADAEPFSSANYLMPFPHDVAHYKARERIISRCTKRYFFSYYREEEDRLRAAAGEIKREQEEIVSTVARRTSQDIENMKLVVERLRCSNAQLAEENSQPVLRDAHAMEIKQRLKELATEVTNYAREKLLLLEGTRAIRRRLAIQNELEQCLDEQLRMLRGDAGCGTRGLLLGDDSIDKDMESIYECQLLLAEEMSQLRKESTCFVRCDEIWEGLWARMMRQELLLAVALELEMMEDIVLGPSSLRWVLESIGATAEAVGDVESPTENADGRAGRVTKLQTINASQLMSALDKSLQQSAKEWSLLSSNCGGGGNDNAATVLSGSGAVRANNSKTISLLEPISLLLSNGEEVKPTRTLVGSHADEAKLQEASVEKLLHDGVHCEITCLPSGFDMSEFSMVKVSPSSQSGADKQPMPTGQWGVLRLVHPPKDASSYCLEFCHRTHLGGNKTRERRVLSIPLGEPQLRITLRVVEADSNPSSVVCLEDTLTITAHPFIVLELQGVPRVAQQHKQPQQVQSERSQHAGSGRWSSVCAEGMPAGGTTLFTSGWELTHVGNPVLTRRLEYGGELLLPASSMSACEEGKGVFLIQFTDPVVSAPTRTESIECIVAALSGLTLPAFTVSAAGGKVGETSDAACTSSCSAINDGCGMDVAAYNHLPHILLGAYGGPLRNLPSTGSAPKASTVSWGMGVSPLGYATTMAVFFYFPRDGVTDLSTASSSTTVVAAVTAAIGAERRSPRTRSAGPLGFAIGMLSRLGKLTLPNCASSSDVRGDVVEFLLTRMQKLHSIRRKTRATVRQQMFDAEDIKAELLYSYSESEFMRDSHIKNVQKEARELVGLQHPRTPAAFPSRVPVHATPALCRELCGSAVSWTLWQWAHRWQALKETYQQQQQQQLGILGLQLVEESESGEDSACDTSLELTATMTASNKVMESCFHPAVCFDQLPEFLSGMV